MRGEKHDAAASLWEAVLQNFTHPEVLRGLGRLYLRSAQRGKRSEPLKDAERAYGCFNACRILEMSQFGRESAVTSYGRAHAILVGVRIAQSVNPFEADYEGSPTLLDLAESRFSSARARSVGGFHRAVSERIEELKNVRRELKLMGKYRQ